MGCARKKHLELRIKDSDESRKWLERLLVKGESETVEFKESLDEEALESVAAFANARGGTLLVGVADNGTVKGVMLGKETIREVTESALKPIPSRGRYFKRVGKSNCQMTDDDLTRTVLEKVGITWDEVVEPRATLDDLDPKQLRRFRALCSEKGRRPIPSGERDATVLEKLGLLRDG